MTKTPTKSEILEKAAELFHNDRCRNGDPSFAITPTEKELRENGYISIAVSELMRDIARAELEGWGTYGKMENLEKNQSLSNEIPFNIEEAKDTGLFTCGANQSRKTTLNKHLVKTMIEHGIIVNVLDISKAWSVFGETPIANTIVIPDTDRPDVQFDIGKNIVFDMSNLSLKHRLEFANAFSKTVYYWQKSFGYKHAPFRFVVYEEAQGYISNGSFRSLRRFCPIVDLISVGANFNIRAALITPFPANVDKTPVKSAQQRYFGRTTEKNDVDYIRKFIGKDMVPVLKDLKAGEFLYQNGTRIEKLAVQRFGNVKSNSSMKWETSFGFPLVS